MSQNVIQTSFAGGELSPTLFARVDLAKYHIGAALLENFFVDYRGGASNRPGTEYVARAFKSGSAVRLIPFQFSTIQNYVLEFGNFYMRVYKNGSQVIEIGKTITAITQANPGVITAPSHGFANGDQVVFFVAGTTLLNNKDYFVAAATTNTFQLVDWDSNPINTAGFGVFTGGTVSRVYTVASPYAASDLALLKFTQSADVMTFTHPAYAPRNLSRAAETNWSFSTISIGETIGPPTPTAISATTSGTASYSYVITAVGADGQESIASVPAAISSAVNIAATAGSITFSWTSVVGAVAYNVYKANFASNGVLPAGILYGYMTTTTSTTAIDTNIVPDFTSSPPTNVNPFTGGNNPGAVAYYQQRKVFAGSNSQPETFWMSRPGQYNNFDISNPVVAGDAITGTLVSKQVNNIKYMISMPGGLIMLTGGGAWQVSGNQGGALSPTTINATPQAYNGCADVEPITINYDILYVQQKGTVVRDLAYNFTINIYTGADLSVLSNHLFANYSIKEWAYAEEPYKIVWSVRSDGRLLSLTYLKEQEVFGWAQHYTQGRFKSITSIQEGQENAVYVVVERLVQGQSRQYIERLHSRAMPYGAEDAWFVDSALSNDLYYPNATLKLAFSNDEILLTIIDDFWASGNIGRVVRCAGGIAEIISLDNTQVARARIIRPFTDLNAGHNPPQIWTQLPGSWAVTLPLTTVSGLDHLEGETVSILGDGNVFPSQVVSGGKVSISQPCSKIVVGLAYTSRLQTLRLDTGEPTVQGKRKTIPAVSVRVDQTRGISVGPTFDTLTEFKDRDLNSIGDPIPLYSGDQRLLIESWWRTEGSIAIEQANPLPATILGVIPEVQIGDTGK